MAQITRFTPLDNPVLDDRNEEQLVEYALDRVYSASGGKINDFSLSSPTRALIEGQAFAGAELLFYLNLLPEAYAIAFLQIAGIQRRLGRASTVVLTFYLSAPLAGVFTIPAGYEVKSGSGNISFTTDTVLIIPAGVTSGTVEATCSEASSNGNLAAYTITGLTQPLAYLQGVTNETAATGGLDEETIDEVKARAFAAIRRRGLVSADDYEQESQSVLGLGSVARAIGNLAADKVSERIGVVHLFCLNSDGSLLNEAQRGQLQASLQLKTHISVSVYVSNIDVQLCDVFLVASMLSGQNPQTIADDIWASLQDYLKPGALPLGETIILKELEFLVRGVGGVDFLQSLTIGNHLQPRLATNYALQHIYSAASIASLGIDLVEGSNVYSYYFGLSDPD